MQQLHTRISGKKRSIKTLSSPRQESQGSEGECSDLKNREGQSGEGDSAERKFNGLKKRVCERCQGWHTREKLLLDFGFKSERLGRLAIL